MVLFVFFVIMFCSTRSIDQNQVLDFEQAGHPILDGDEQDSGFKLLICPLKVTIKTKIDNVIK